MRGRPPKLPDQRLTEVIQVRTTADERAAMEKSANGNLSKWARDVLVKAANRAAKKP